MNRNRLKSFCAHSSKPFSHTVRNSGGLCYLSHLPLSLSSKHGEFIEFIRDVMAMTPFRHDLFVFICFTDYIGIGAHKFQLPNQYYHHPSTIGYTVCTWDKSGETTINNKPWWKCHGCDSNFKISGNENPSLFVITRFERHSSSNWTERYRQCSNPLPLRCSWQSDDLLLFL